MSNVEEAVRALDFVRQHVNVGTHSPNKVLIGMENQRPPAWMIDSGKEYWTDYDDRMFAGSKDSWLTEEEPLDYTKRTDVKERTRREMYRLARRDANTKLESMRKQHGPGMARTSPEGKVIGRNPETWKQVLKYGKMVSEVGVGNCSDLAMCAAYYLVMKRGLSCVDVVTLELSDHAFATIGQPLPGAGNYPAEFANWQAVSAICDPWADIACKATDFPERWKGRMKNWASAGLLFVDSRGIKEAAKGDDPIMVNLLSANKKPFINGSLSRSKPLWI